MQQIIFTLKPQPTYRLAILIKKTGLNKRELEKYYINSLADKGITKESVVCLEVKYDKNNKALKKDSIEWVTNNLLPVLDRLKIKVIAIADSKYFEYITGNKSSSYLQSFCKGSIAGFEGITCVPIVNYKAIQHNTMALNKLVLSINSVPNAMTGLPNNIGTRTITNQFYPVGYIEIKEALEGLYTEPTLSIDIEAFSLDHTEAGIGTISFSPDDDTFIAFKVQYEALGRRVENLEVYKLLKLFFSTYSGEMIFHRGSYDIKILIYELFMLDDSDYTGLVEGIKCFDNIQDTMLMTYVSTNNTVQNSLGLKDNTMEFAGNYAIDVKDISIHEPSIVLEYNGRDTCNTVYLRNKYWNKMTAEKTYEAYKILLDSILVIIQLEIIGFPMSMDHSKDLYNTVTDKLSKLNESITNSTLVKEFVDDKTLEEIWDYNLTSKTRIVNIKTYPKAEFNPGSDLQVADLIHNKLKVGVLDKTLTGLPSMGVVSLIKLKHINKTKIPLIDKFIELKQLQTNYTNFVTKFVTKARQKNGKGIYYLHGDIKLCTTISGRPTGGGMVNMLALPSTGSILAKPVKQCFRADKDRLLAGADFAGLEDVCASIVTKDSAMLSGKLLGRDGHSTRAIAYFPEELPDHVKLIEQAETATKFYYDETKQGLDCWILK